MDTGTHLVIGLGLAGLAYIDPVVATDSSVATAVLIGTVVGSQAPDFDTLLRLKGNALYIRNHRGKSHSLPALFLWTALISLVLFLLFRDLPMAHVTMWVFIAVAFHVFTDLFNTYGTQAFRPITEKWISWNIIHIFDPFIFAGHLVAIFLWSIRLVPPQVIFPTLYGLLALYYVWRTVAHASVVRDVKHQDPQPAASDKYVVIPTINRNIWNVMKQQTGGRYVLGDYRNGRLRWIDHLTCADHPAVEASKSHPDVASLLYFSSYACADVREKAWGYEVRWADARYRHRKQYPFVAVLLMDKEFRPLDSYVGWLSEGQIDKKLKIDAY